MLWIEMYLNAPKTPIAPEKIMTLPGHSTLESVIKSMPKIATHAELRAEVKDLRDALTELRDYTYQEMGLMCGSSYSAIWKFYDKVQEHISVTLDGEVDKSVY